MRLVAIRDIREPDLAHIEAPFFACSKVRQFLLGCSGFERISGIPDLGRHPAAFDLRQRQQKLLQEIEEGSWFLVIDSNPGPLRPPVRWHADDDRNGNGQWIVEACLAPAARFNLMHAVARIERDSHRPHLPNTRTPGKFQIQPISGNAWDGMRKRYANLFSDHGAYPQHLTAAEEKGIGSKLRNLYDGNDTIQNQADIEAYNNTPSFLGVTHGQIFDAMETIVTLAGLFEGGLALSRLRDAGRATERVSSALHSQASVRATASKSIGSITSNASGANSSNRLLNLNGRDIATKIDGHTLQSTKIAQAIEKGDIKVSVLGDELFERALGETSDTAALAVGNKIYLRRNSNSVLSDAIHEGTHALDYLNGFGLEAPKTIWQWEKRAFYYERQFQLSVDSKPEFSSPHDMMFHIWSNYENRFFSPW